jgi:hypothetical protein
MGTNIFFFDTNQSETAQTGPSAQAAAEVRQLICKKERERELIDSKKKNREKHELNNP